MTLPITNAQLRALNETDVRAIFNMAREELMWRRDRKIAEARRDYRVGDLVKFATNYGRQVVMRITKINPKTLHGTEVDPVSLRDGVTPWRVTPTLCSPFEPPKRPEVEWEPKPVTPVAPKGIGAGSF